MKHTHLFQHVGGGCNIKEHPNTGSCDDSYECDCGAKFRTSSNQATHFTMPQYIAGKDEPEEVESQLI